ncbi:glycine zipper 2TM domain-containing protein [Croceicoccus marinus]|uniref:17 kDa surface antigen n=1 Tax=Croceicoccus marinus TaxID=450378 RepID=A0A7G6VRS7_9SPHN|nr:glycine zipper 2TM domain-containing protein [Croceicoccus marinus]QNE04442.1 glycine zipper 2TM domain-containing protein [Croceicoccus marinus]
MRMALIGTVLAAAVAIPAAPAAADPPPWAPAYGKRAKDRHYYEPRRMHSGDRYWRGDDGRYHCKRDDGTTGLIIGAAGGALLGREIDGGRDRTTGTVLGAAAGALIGRAIDRGDARCR